MSIIIIIIIIRKFLKNKEISWNKNSHSPDEKKKAFQLHQTFTNHQKPMQGAGETKVNWNLFKPIIQVCSFPVA